MRTLTDSDVYRESFRRLAPIEFDPFLLAPAGTDGRKLRHLISAADAADEIFWRQTLSDENRESILSAARNDLELKEIIEFQYGLYDRLNGFLPLLPVGPKPLGAGYYPPDLSREDFFGFLASHPEAKHAFNSPYTVIRKADSALRAIPFHEYYQPQVASLSRSLSAAARIEEQTNFRRYLEQRAQDILTDDYFESDRLWVALRDNPLDLVIGPYEVYEDRLLGIKAAYEAMLLTRDSVGSNKIRDVNSNLRFLRCELEAQLKHQLAIEQNRVDLSVATLVYSGGEARSAIPAIAFNLPNDERVIEEVGARQVLLANVLEAKFRSVAWPLMKRIFERTVSDEDGALLHFFNHTLYHEISHSLGPHRILVDGEHTTVNSCLRQHYTVLEEIKADVLGVCLNLVMADRASHAALIDVYVAGFLRAARFGLDQAHGGSNAVQFNYLLAHGGLRSVNEYVSVSHDTAHHVLFRLASDVLSIQEAGDFNAAERFLSAYRVMSPELKALIGRLNEIPVDIRITYKQSSFHT